jgi:hypothetical protein
LQHIAGWRRLSCTVLPIQARSALKQRGTPVAASTLDGHTEGDRTMGTQTSALTRATLATAVATAALSFSLGTAAFAQQPSVSVRGDDITIRGCVGRATPGAGLAQPSLVWTRSDIMLSNAMSVGGAAPSSLADRVFYWLDDEDDLAKHVGQQVEIKGDLGDFKKGEIEMKRDGEFTNIELKLGGKTEKARVPTAWLGTSAREREVDIISRKVDVDKVKVIGACERH